jgi:hypothetical protein
LTHQVNHEITMLRFVKLESLVGGLSKSSQQHLNDQVKLQVIGGPDMSLFLLDASIRVEGSHSRAIADIVEQQWRDAHPGESVIRRHAAVDPIPATAWATAVNASRTPESHARTSSRPRWRSPRP